MGGKWPNIIIATFDKRQKNSGGNHSSRAIFPIVPVRGQSEPAPTNAPVGFSSKEWAALFHPTPDPALTNIVPHSNFFGC